MIFTVSKDSVNIYKSLSVSFMDVDLPALEVLTLSLCISA